MTFVHIAHMGKLHLPTSPLTHIKVNKQHMGVPDLCTPIIYVPSHFWPKQSTLGFCSLHNRVDIKMGIIYKNVNIPLLLLEISEGMKYYIFTGN